MKNCEGKYNFSEIWMLMLMKNCEGKHNFSEMWMLMGKYKFSEMWMLMGKYNFSEMWMVMLMKNCEGGNYFSEMWMLMGKYTLSEMWMVMLMKNCEEEIFFLRIVDVDVEVCVRVFWRQILFYILLLCQKLAVSVLANFSSFRQTSMKAAYCGKNVILYLFAELLSYLGDGKFLSRIFVGLFRVEFSRKFFYHEDV